MGLLLLDVGGSGGTDPHTWANRLLEEDISIAASVLETLSPNVPVDADGDLIIAIEDQGTAGTRSPLQTTSGNRAVYKVGITPTGLAVARFDGGDDKYQLAAAIAAAEMQSFTLLAVFKAGGTGARTLISSNASDGACQVRVSNDNKVAVLKNNVVQVGSSSTNTIVVGKWNCIGVRYADPTLDHFLNGDTNGTSTDSVTFTSDTTGFGHSKNAEFWNGDIAYLLVCADLKTNAEILSAMTFLRRKFGTQ